MQVEPFFDRILLKPDDPKEMTESGLIIPALAQEKTKSSTVVAVGAGVTLAKVGDRVLHTRYAGVEIELDRITYTIVPEEELLGRLVS